jgi:hypothetical protein
MDVSFVDIATLNAIARCQLLLCQKRAESQHTEVAAESGTAAVWLGEKIQESSNSAPHFWS